MADPGFPRGRANPQGRGGCQSTRRPKFPENCMKMKKIGPGDVCPQFVNVDPPLVTISVPFYLKLHSYGGGVDPFYSQNRSLFYSPLSIYKPLYITSLLFASSISIRLCVPMFLSTLLRRTQTFCT